MSTTGPGPTHLAVTVRPATSDDVGFLSDAHRAGLHAIAEVRGGELDSLLRGRPEPIGATFEAELDDPDFIVEIGCLDGVPVGYLVLERRLLRDHQRTLAVIRDLWVHPEIRGVGVGSELMTQAYGHGREWEAIGLDSRALPGDRFTKNFFESFGLVVRTIEVFGALD